MDCISGCGGCIGAPNGCCGWDVGGNEGGWFEPGLIRFIAE